MVQFMVQNGVYAYARQHEGKTVFVMLNGTDAETTVPLKFYKEILKDSKQGKDILSGKTVAFGESLTMGPRESLVIEISFLCPFFIHKSIFSNLSSKPPLTNISQTFD